MHGYVEQECVSKIVHFIIFGVEVLPPGRGQTWDIVCVSKRSK
jgi:hypothetical protein